MPTSMNISLTDVLWEFANSRAGDGGLYSSRSGEYLRDLIRRDMETQGVVRHVKEGLADIKAGRFSEKSVMDLLDEDFRAC